jgi:hypothetical protein
MGWITALSQLLKVVGQVISLFAEKDKKKAETKKTNIDRLTNAAKETDPKKRASKLNRVLDDVKRMR